MTIKKLLITCLAGFLAVSAGPLSAKDWSKAQLEVWNVVLAVSRGHRPQPQTIADLER